LIDCDRASWNMDPDLLAQELEACSRRGWLPKAVVPSDLYGQCVDLGRILDICRPYNIPVVLIHPEELGVDRESVRLALEEQNIESRPVWKSMYLQPVFGGGNGNGSEPSGAKPSYHARVVGGEVSEYLFERGLCLPSGTQMSEADIERVVSVIRRAHKR
jgi:dTDP-4-amino-4,6-dideoxygalactose transaminase